jgi:preprotein translocase subunit SecY
MFKAFGDAFKIPELRRRILFTLGMLVICRLGCHVPTPGIDGHALSEFFTQSRGTLMELFDLFAGGALRRATIFALGIMPYISASIILQLLTAVMPNLARLAREGEAGRRKITQYTRYGTVILSLLQSFGLTFWLQSLKSPTGIPVVPHSGPSFQVIAVMTMTCGTVFLMWLGEQISERGIGNGISLIILVGIVARLPAAGIQTASLMRAGTISFVKLFFMLAIMVGIVAAIVILETGQRRVPVQYAKRIVGRKIYGGQSTHIPLRVNTSGMIPIIFASAILMVPATMAQFINHPFTRGIATQLAPDKVAYNLLYFILIIFFCYFYTAIVFNPADVADNIKRYGGFVPGIRPGRATSEYIDHILTRITLGGAIGLALIAIFPWVVMLWLKIPYLVASFFGGAGLIIVVGVVLDTMRQVESHLLMRHYEGFIKKGKIKGRF